MEFKNVSQKIFHLTESKIDFVRFILERADGDYSGKISKEELKNLPEKLAALILSMDTNNDGQITVDELWAGWKKDNRVTTSEEEELMIGEAANRFFNVERFFKELAGGKNQIDMADCHNKLGFREHDGGVYLGNLLNIFTRIDKAGDGKIGLYELWDFFFDVYFPDVQGELNMIKFFNDADTNKSGTLCWHEIEDVLNKMDSKMPLEMKVIESLKDQKGDIKCEEFIKKWKQMVRNQKYPVKAKRGQQHDEETLIKYAMKRTEIRDGHKKMLNRGKTSVRPEFLKDLLRMDKDNDGQVSFDEIWSEFKREQRMGLTLEENIVVNAISDEYSCIKDCFEWVDEDKNGKLTMDECLNKFGNDEGNDSDTLNNMGNIIHRIDKDKDSQLTLKELWDYFRVIAFPDISKEIELLRLFHDIDEDGNGSLDREELMGSEYVEVLDEAVQRGHLSDGKITLPELMGTWKDMIRNEKFPKKA